MGGQPNLVPQVLLITVPSPTFLPPPFFRHRFEHVAVSMELNCAVQVDIGMGIAPIKPGH